jgi:hypothetical protein
MRRVRLVRMWLVRLVRPRLEPVEVRRVLPAQLQL